MPDLPPSFASLSKKWDFENSRSYTADKFAQELNALMERWLAVDSNTAYMPAIRFGGRTYVSLDATLGKEE